MIFAARQLQEKCMEQHRDLYTTFGDMTMAFRHCQPGRTLENHGKIQLSKHIHCSSPPIP